jgi:hypothetical protein
VNHCVSNSCNMEHSRLYQLVRSPPPSMSHTDVSHVTGFTLSLCPRWVCPFIRTHIYLGALPPEVPHWSTPHDRVFTSQCSRSQLWLTLIIIKNTTFWDITPCSPLKVNRRFQRNISPPSSGSKKLCVPRWFLTRLILRPLSRRRHVPPKRRLTFNGLHCVISQKIELFLTTAVRTSNPTWLYQFGLLQVANLGVKITGLMVTSGSFCTKARHTPSDRVVTASSYIAWPSMCLHETAHLSDDKNTEL